MSDNNTSVDSSDGTGHTVGAIVGLLLVIGLGYAIYAFFNKKKQKKQQDKEELLERRQSDKIENNPVNVQRKDDNVLQMPSTYYPQEQNFAL